MVVELARMPYAMAAYRTYRRPSSDNAGSLPIDDVLAEDHEGYSHARFYHMADAMQLSGIDPLQLSQGLLSAAITIAKFNGVMDEYLEYHEKWAKRYLAK